MRRPKHQMTSGEDLFVGIDLHKHRWHVTIRTFDVEVFSASIPGTWEALHRVLARYPGHPLQAVYEAGYFGFRLHDRLVDHGISTPQVIMAFKFLPSIRFNLISFGGCRLKSKLSSQL
jgi:hypothetical protein